MSELAASIKRVRTRLGETMAEFAETLGTQQSTISRYESGQVAPSGSTLILLYLLAVEEERSVFAEALGVEDATKLERKYGAVKKQLDDLKRSRTASRPAVEFAELAAVIADSGDVDESAVELLRLLSEHGKGKPLRKAIAVMLPYFRYTAND